jgi:hypothetical protein
LLGSSPWSAGGVSKMAEVLKKRLFMMSDEVKIVEETL